MHTPDEARSDAADLQDVHQQSGLPTRAGRGVNHVAPQVAGWGHSAPSFAHLHLQDREAGHRRNLPAPTGMSLDRKLDLIGILMLFVGLLTLLSIISASHNLITASWLTFFRAGIWLGSLSVPSRADDCGSVAGVTQLPARTPRSYRTTIWSGPILPQHIRLDAFLFLS